MWADNETSEDLLGFKIHADLLIDVIRDDKVLPVTVGVFGDWGSGKSSILKIVYENLKSSSDKIKDDTVVLYFNGWVFEGYDDAKAALLESIVNAFEEHKTIRNKIKDNTAKLLRSVKWMRVLGFGFKKVLLPTATAYFSGGLSLIPFLAQEFSKQDPAKLAEQLASENGEGFLKDMIKDKEDDDMALVREFRDDFKKMIDKSEIKKLVVIIDDLDRCTPDRIIENLEAIKLFLNVEKTAFLIGADPRIVRHAIEHKYKTDSIENADDPNSRNRRIVSDYLEKLIQVPYNLPKLSDSEVETYMTLLFCKKELNGNFAKVLSAFDRHRSANRYGVFGFGDIQGLITEEENRKLGESVSLIASLSSIITEGLNGNPRQVKRFLNTFTLRNRLVKVANLQNFKVDVLAKLMVLEYSSSELFRKIFEWQSTQQGEPKELFELEALASKDNKDDIKSKYSTEWATDKILRWLNVAPKLAQVDLRDYYWISRDQLTGAISGSSLIPTHVRLLFTKLLEHGSGKILNGIISSEVVDKISGAELEALYSLLEKELLKTPESDATHKIYIELMAQNVSNSVESYGRVIKQADQAKIPFSIHNELKLALNKNSEISSVIKSFRSDTQIGRAVKPKK